MKVVILGYASQGQSAYEYWQNQGADITIRDKNPDADIPSSVKKQLGDDYLKALDQFDLIIRTPALHPSEILKANPETPDILDRVTTVTNEFFKVCPTKNIIGVTGTKGKGTTSTLITRMLEACGKTVHLGGNIGTPPLELLKRDIKPDDWVVLELANFQLIDLKYSPHIAVCLMVVPEHLDWHKDYAEYLEAKKPLFAHQTASDIAIYNADNQDSVKVAFVTSGKTIGYMHKTGAHVDGVAIKIDEQVVCHINQVKLLGKHNLENVCASVTAVWQITQDIDAIKSAITSFTGLEHRLELVRELDGVKYFNDSFAATPDASVAAMQAISGQKVLILGGFDRGLDLEVMTNAIQKYQDQIRSIILIGETGPKLANLLEKLNVVKYQTLEKKDMASIVKTSRSVAQPGDKIVLSPGFASFDMFKNFEDRGNQFKDCVNNL